MASLRNYMSLLKPISPDVLRQITVLDVKTKMCIIIQACPCIVIAQMTSHGSKHGISKTLIKGRSIYDNSSKEEVFLTHGSVLEIIPTKYEGFLASSDDGKTCTVTNSDGTPFKRLVKIPNQFAASLYRPGDPIQYRKKVSFNSYLDTYDVVTDCVNTLEVLVVEQ